MIGYDDAGMDILNAFRVFYVQLQNAEDCHFPNEQFEPAQVHRTGHRLETLFVKARKHKDNREDAGEQGACSAKRSVRNYLGEQPPNIDESLNKFHCGSRVFKKVKA